MAKVGTGHAIAPITAIGTGADGADCLPVSNTNPFPVSVRSGRDNLEYEIVAASQTAQVIGATGAAGDYLSHVIFYPATTGAATSIVLDNAIEVAKYTAGTLADLRPIIIPVNAVSVSGAWKVTTGANMTATAFGDFT
jgi:hypothetical protein